MSDKTLNLLLTGPKSTVDRLLESCYPNHSGIVYAKGTLWPVIESEIKQSLLQEAVDAGLNNNQIAQRLGVSAPTVANWRLLYGI